MVTIGVDAHKAVHAAVALDAAGQVLGQWRGTNSRAGWGALHAWAVGLGAPRQWGIEGVWNYGRGLAQHLVDADETVYEVNPRWPAEGRRSARRPGKSDALDAQAVARLVLREAATLPRVGADDETAVLELLVTERDGAVAEATRLRNQLHQLLLQADPEYQAHLPALRTPAGVAALEHYAAPGTRPLDQERAAAVRRLAQRLRLALAQAEDLAAQIRQRAQARFALLTGLCGVSLLTAGALAGILGPGHRFRTDAQLAAYAGVAPLEASSAGRVRHRLNRGGNRRLNAILHRMAIAQARSSPAARAYLTRREAEGKTRREALRALKRFLVRAVWRLWQECVSQPPARPAIATLAAA
jgi:transposase